MGEIIHEALLIYNFPVTLLLGICVVYWITVCFGILDVGSLDADVDVHAHVDAHLDVDGDVATDLDAHVNGDVHGGPLTALARFVNVHEVPLMVVLSFQLLFMWMICLITNHYINTGELIGIGLGVLAGSFIVAAIFTRFVTMPLKPLMRGLKKEWDEEEPMVGATGTVRTAEVSEEFGQVEVERSGAPVFCHARIPEGSEPLSRGDTVLVIDYDSKSQTCIVKPLEGEQLEI